MPAIVNQYLTWMQASSLPVMNSYFPHRRMLRGFALAQGLKWCLSVAALKLLKAPTKRWLKDFGVDYDWLHLVPNGTSYEKHIKRTLAEHKRRSAYRCTGEFVTPTSRSVWFPPAPGIV
ncbi:hypothetical protein MJK71_29150 [Escherichia coli]|nr:hypothetical protein MJK71_29150 [Escherichia coli]